MSLSRPKRNSLVVLALFVVGGWAIKYVSEIEMRRLDKEVDRLCAVDGGSVIHEAVRLPAEKFNQHGQPLVPFGRDDTGFGYFKRSTTEQVAGPPDHYRGASLKRFESQIIRTSDGKVIATSILYNRSGGDWLRQYFLVGQGKSCASIEEPWAFNKRVFIRQ